MLKICHDTLVEPLMLIFSASQQSSLFPACWKRGNIIPCYKKGEKYLVKNYRPVSLLSIPGKIFEKCLYDSLYSYFEEHDHDG